MAEVLNDALLNRPEQEAWYYRWFPCLKRQAPPAINPENPVPPHPENPVLPPAIDLENPVPPHPQNPVLPPAPPGLLTASTYTAQALVVGVEGVAAILPILVTAPGGSFFVIPFTMMPLLGFLIAASADLLRLIWGLSPERFRIFGLALVYLGYFGLTFVLLLAHFCPSAFNAKICFTPFLS